VKEFHRLKDPAQNDVEQNARSNADTRHLEYGDGIALLGHPCESGGAAFEVRAERRKDIVLEDYSCQAHVHINVIGSDSSPGALSSRWAVSWSTYRMIESVLIPRVVMDVDRHISEGGDFG
jgi:hypothetical protein